MDSALRSCPCSGVSPRSSAQSPRTGAQSSVTAECGPASQSSLGPPCGRGAVWGAALHRGAGETSGAEGVER